MNRNYLIGALSSSILLSLAWFESFSGLFLLIAFVPLLLVEQHAASHQTKGVFRYYAGAFLLWNIITTWWIYNATAFGAFVAFFGNTLQMCLIWYLFIVAKRRTTPRIGYTFLVISWITWEWFYLDAEISWTWLELGNGFAKDIHLIQWYQYTGTLGGTLWAWVANLFVFAIVLRLISNKKNRNLPENASQIRPTRALLIGLLLWVGVPIGLSMYQFNTYIETVNPCKALVIQPNIEPFTEKFNNMSYQEQTDLVVQMMTDSLDTSFDYVISPETAFPGVHWENNISQDPDVIQVQTALHSYPTTSFVGGLMSYFRYSNGQNKTPIARSMQGSDDFYDAFNSAILINNSQTPQIYHKSKLVVGAEMLPYHASLPFLSKFSIDLGGTSGTLGTQKTQDVFHSTDKRFAIGPAICFESIYGEHFSNFVRSGANIMCIITNDGWWRDTPGHRQHFRFASLRAIETRRSIFRSGNTGISALINQRGEIIAQTKWAERTVLSGTLHANSALTFYTLYGDYIGRIACLIFLLYGGYIGTRRLRA